VELFLYIYTKDLRNFRYPNLPVT